MPCNYRIFTTENLVSKSYSGRITTRCVLEMLDEIEKDPRYREGMAEFDDLRGVTDLDITATDIAHFAELVTGLNTRKRRPLKKAVLAKHGPSQAAAYAFCKMVEGAANFEVEVFDSLSAALDFLGIDAGDDHEKSLVVNVQVH